MQIGDLIQHIHQSQLIYTLLNEVVDPEDGLMNFILLDSNGKTMEWGSDTIKHLYKVINAQNPDPKCK